MYGDLKAITIINNCDTYVYMGGMDITTCKHIAEKANKPVHRILSMPLEHVIVFRRGCEPVISRRYQTLEDPLYKETFNKSSSDAFSEKDIDNTDQNTAEDDTENVLENVI
jgi:hypothetical protein